MDKTTPKAFAILFILSTIPSFYFIHQMFEHDYNTEEYIQNSHNSIKYFYLKNFIFYGASMILFKMNFRNPSSKYTLERLPPKFQYVPLILGFLGIMLPPSDSKHVVWPAFFTDIFTMAFEVQITNQGIIPFWFYSYRHFIRFFDMMIFVIVYQSLKKYRNRRETHPHEFVKEVGNEGVTEMSKVDVVPDMKSLLV